MVLVYIENTAGQFKKSAWEAVSYAREVADRLQTSLTALSIGEAGEEALREAGKYGASRILSVSQGPLKKFTARAYAAVIAEAAQKEDATVVIMSSSFSGKGLAPRVAVRLQAALAPDVIEPPETGNGDFTVRKKAFSGKAIAKVRLTPDKKVLTLAPNSFPLKETPETPEISSFEPSALPEGASVVIRDTIRSAGKISLPEAEKVVSAGRGLKGPENWGMIEELAGLLGAALACSKPVSDAGWRPHSEHVGQTGITISPNLYFAVGISGAIQHLAGVSSSKVIVVINKDPEAPFFKAADYGIVGDAFEVVPKLIEALKKAAS